MHWIGLVMVGGVFASIIVGHVIETALGRDGRIRRGLAGVRQFPIGSVPPRCRGRIAGMVVPVGRPLIAPLTGRRCVYYRTRVEQISLSGTGLETTSELLVETRIVPFAIDDGTGYALVDVARAEVLAGNDLDQHARGAVRMTPSQLALLARHDVSPRGLVFDKSLVFIESIIEVGERIAAAGLCVPAATTDNRDRAPSDPYRNMPHEPDASHVRLVDPRDGRVLITDDQRFAQPLDREA